MTNRSDEGGEPPTRSLRATRPRRARAEGLLLESIITHRPLPGIGRVVTFADLGSDVGAATVVLVDDREPSALGFPTQIRVVDDETLKTLSSERELPVLRFLQSEVLDGKITIRLQLCIALPQEDPIPVEGIVATFNDSEPLTAVEPTHILAF